LERLVPVIKKYKVRFTPISDPLKITMMALHVRAIGLRVTQRRWPCQVVSLPPLALGNTNTNVFCQINNNSKLISCRRNFTTDDYDWDKHDWDADYPDTPGSDAFIEYEMAAEDVQRYKDDLEEAKSKEMFQSYDEQTDSTNKKAAGVAVLKTLVKETQKQQEQEANQLRALEQEAMAKLEKAAFVHNYPPAHVELGNLALARATAEFAKSDATKNKSQIYYELDQAQKSYETAGAMKDSQGLYNLAHLLWTGYPDQTKKADNTDNEITDTDEPITMYVEQDKERAMQLFEQCIELQDFDAMYFVGVQKMSLEIGNDNYLVDTLRAGLDLIQQAADRGHPGAYYYLAVFYLNGHAALGVPPCDTARFMELLDRAADAGDEDGLFMRGHAYYHGEHGYKQNFELSLTDFLIAAELDHGEAAVSAGAMLHTGKPGVPRDRKKAFALYQHAGELGVLAGWRNVVACYALGQGVPKSVQMARYIANTMLKQEEVQDPFIAKLLEDEDD
jgi:TPR repeat protein